MNPNLVGNQIEANESEDEFENNESRIAKAKAKAKAVKKHGKSVQWVTVLEFDDISSFVVSDVDVKLKTQFIQQKNRGQRPGIRVYFGASLVKNGDISVL